MMMKLSEQRSIALGASRSKMRATGIDPKLATAQDALRILDDSYRIDPDTIAAQWYWNASGNQIKLFEREWRKWIKNQHCMN
jgi:hypothetical protein